MSNRELKATWVYHDGTKHSLFSMHNDPHYMDFDNQPLPFKIYTDLEPTPLPGDYGASQVPALAAISDGGALPGRDSVPDLRTLASIFHHSAGVTRSLAYPGGDMLFRAASCTGALYHIEVYLVCTDLPGLEAGVYHSGAHDSALRRLREGDYRGTLAHATGGEPAVAGAPAVVVCTSTYWRNAWKYRSRAYRHCFWDNGTILANLLAMAVAHGVPAKVVASFADEPVNRLLGLDTEQEVAISLVPLGRSSSYAGISAREVSPLDLNVTPLSKSQVDYPAIGAMHQASSLETWDEARAMHGPTPVAAMPEPSGRLFPLKAMGDREVALDSIERVIVRRGSTRQFVRRPISFEQLSTILHRVTKGVPADFLEPAGATLNDLYLIVNAVDGLPQGAYVFHRDRAALELLREGDFRQAGGYLGLQQALPADASVDVFFLTDLESVLERYGNRGYRAAQLESGILGGKLYLAAYAQRLGATGLTFFDDDVTSFFSPHAAGKSVMFLVAVGVPLRRSVTRR